MLRMMDLNNVTALVSGAGSGMGAVTARMLAERGARVAVLDLDSDRAHQTAESIGGLAVSADVSNGPSVEAALQQVVDELGAPRVAVSCAGIAPASRIVGRDGPHELDLYQQVINVNLVGTFNVLRLASARMATLEPISESGSRGVIVNTASVAAYEGQIGQAAYSSSKGGVVALTLPAARELARFGIRVMTIAPGLIGTPMLLNMPAPVQDSLAGQAPFPQRFGRAEEFAELVLHIVDNEMLNGEVIRLDGAIRLQPT
ncbi:MAG: SDR family NAD(P)-dependent oxidoreductase [Arenicellales bacterium]|jgi:NAD(P)-dependent dehydrogenase (short-subunit alcohol dehydrogenase family)|nr:SDR family NAD(P)-dependent oxidoreductase [Arenicellales bacterium]